MLHDPAVMADLKKEKKTTLLHKKPLFFNHWSSFFNKETCAVRQIYSTVLLFTLLRVIRKKLDSNIIAQDMSYSINQRMLKRSAKSMDLSHTWLIKAQWLSIDSTSDHWEPFFFQREGGVGRLSVWWPRDKTAHVRHTHVYWFCILLNMITHYHDHPQRICKMSNVSVIALVRCAD